MEATTFELKYCERCGTLGLRRSESTENYCEPCGRMLMNHPLARDWMGRPLSARTIRRRKMVKTNPGQLSLATGGLQ
jgi:hypothetical protein